MERELLTSLGLADINLEIVLSMYESGTIAIVQLFSNCERHVAFRGKPPRTCHCSGIEVQVFAKWIEHYIGGSNYSS